MKAIEKKGTHKAKIENKRIEAPIFYHGAQAKNWMAKVTGPSATKPEREFFEREWGGLAGYTVPVEGMAENDVIEVCADHYMHTSKGNWPQTWRHFYRVKSITAEEIRFDQYYTLAQAMKDAKRLREASAS